jgi:hypothetical protein
MTANALFKPLLIAAIALNIVSAAWLSGPDAEEPTATPRPPPRACPAP